MLLVSEAYFFDEPAPARQEKVVPRQANRDGKDFMGISLLPARFALDAPA